MMTGPPAVLTPAGATVLAFAHGANDVSSGLRQDPAAFRSRRLRGLAGAWLVTPPAAAALAALAARSLRTVA